MYCTMWSMNKSNHCGCDRQSEWVTDKLLELLELLFATKKFCVWLCWRGWRGRGTQWRRPTTDSHGDSWLLGVPPGPVRPSLSNLTPPGSPGGSMLMQALVRTPDQHDPVNPRPPLLKSSLRTCLLVAGLQELATTPGKRERLRQSWGLRLVSADSSLVRAGSDRESPADNKHLPRLWHSHCQQDT